MGIDYYGVLQITRTSSDVEIKRAYRNLVLEFNRKKLHNEDEREVFAIIGEAFEVLSDPLKRAIFDQYGEEGLKRGVCAPNKYIPGYHYHGDPEKTYKLFFGTSSPYGELLGALNDPSKLSKTTSCVELQKKQIPIRHQLQLSLHEVFFGGVKKMKIHRLAFIDEERVKTDVQEKILSIPIKPGIKPGTEIIFSNEGDQNTTNLPADVIFITEDRPHECFVRQGDDLILTTKVSLEEALLGTIVTVSTIDHRTIRVPITDIVSPNFEKVVENEGLPILDRYPDKGNLILKFIVEFPDYLPNVSKELLQRAFSLANITNREKQHEAINKLVLADKILRVDPDEQLTTI